jgi:hypothetical protein
VILACSHHTGLRLGGDLVIAGPNSPGATVHRGFALTDLMPDQVALFDKWLADNKTGPLISNGVLIWGDNKAAVEWAITEGGLSGYVRPLGPPTVPPNDTRL